MAWQFGTLVMFGYDVIVADPPWDFENYSDAGRDRSGAGGCTGVGLQADFRNRLAQAPITEMVDQ
jgi:hypothetical protein